MHNKYEKYVDIDLDRGDRDRERSKTNVDIFQVHSTRPTARFK